MKNFRFNQLSFFFYLLLSIVLANRFFSFPSSLKSNNVFETDGIFTQVQIQSFIDGAVFGSTNNLGFPFGYSHWLSPQFSSLEAIFIYLLGNITSITNVGIISIVGIITLLLNAISMHFLGLFLTSERMTSITFGVIGLTTPFAFNSLLHPHVMKIYTIPITLIILTKLIRRETFGRRFILIVILSILNSSLFWINALLAIFIVLILIQLLDFALIKKFPKNLVYYTKTSLFILFGFIVNTILYIYNSKLMGDKDRLAWQTDIFSGKFTDVLVGSPLINSQFKIFKDLTPGTSPEAWSIMLGIPLVIAFFANIYFSISSAASNENSEVHRVLKQISIISILFFVLGGLSNLQASFFVLIGSSSPMRTWSRLSIIIAIIGLCLIYLFFNNRIKKNTNIFISCILIIFALVEVFSSPKNIFADNNWSRHELHDATTFIGANLKPCPVLQLPVDTYLIPQSALDKGYRYYWSGLIPYIFLPKFQWTAATYTNSFGWTGLRQLPSTLNGDSLVKISKNYCAILFDKNFSQYQIDRKAGLDGTEGLWPGLRIETNIRPQFDDSRFSVYLLRKS